jgi:predicted  nucleic acid-binding Zn-ribbon protein
MIFDVAAVSGLVALLLSSLNLIAHVRTMLSQGEKKLDERVTKLEHKLIEHDRRVQTLEGEMKHLPDRATLHTLDVALTKISGRLDTLDERLKPIAATSGRLQEYLLEQAQK